MKFRNGRHSTTLVKAQTDLIILPWQIQAYWRSLVKKWGAALTLADLKGIEPSTRAFLSCLE